MIIKTAIQLSIVSVTMLLTACDSFRNDDINSICKDSPELCADIHKIGDCRFKRTTVIRARYYDKIEPSEDNQRKLLNELDEYESCLELTLFMQFTRNKVRKQKRVENYLTAQKLMQEQLLESKGTQDPMLAYYLWTRHQDLKAREVFLSAATKEDVTDTRLLFKLATVNAQSDPQQALTIFYRALKSSQSLEEIPHSSYAIIMTIFYQHKQFEEAYVWALLAEEEDEEDEFPINLELILKKGIVSGDKVIRNEVQLEDKAEYYYKLLKSGKFNEQAPILK
ncbi:hypothetical protein CW745_13815 [Psychromonas sp. psych-6C06]|uniref:DUF2989 domain-containing protein n=1 Tax=Psychromonas sp. psych-6C06 TaxID=2058089 RepID=UPI000C344355|nr:DUF2989 domain-containing protein [Psychromonas sp. psych-6C06]PKF60603.1 hypothetical protein CW745_13815 [Psychromonas sp. psych-6C06]